jgi:hypothetical protein
VSLAVVLVFASPDVMSHDTAPAPAGRKQFGHGSLKIAHGSRTGGAPLKAIDERASALPGHFTPPPYPDAVAKSDFARIIDQLIEKSSKVRRLQEREETAPESSWFGDTKSSIRKELSAAFESVEEILFVGMPYDYVGQFEKQSENLQQSKKEIENLHLELPTDTQIPGPHMGGKRVRVDDSKTRMVKIKIDTYEKNISAIIQSIKLGFDAMGVDFSEFQISILLKRIDSRDILTSLKIFNVTDIVMIILISDMRYNIDNIDVIEIYYDVYLLLWETINYNQNKDIFRIRQGYMPRVQKVIARADEEISTINQLLEKDSGEVQKSELEEALRANLLNRQVAISYAKLLKVQAARIASANMRVVENLPAVYSVLTSVDNGADLISYVDQSRQYLDLLAGVQAPVIEPFESDREADVFADLTIRLRDMN